MTLRRRRGQWLLTTPRMPRTVFSPLLPTTGLLPSATYMEHWNSCQCCHCHHVSSLTFTYLFTGNISHSESVSILNFLGQFLRFLLCWDDMLHQWGWNFKFDVKNTPPVVQVCSNVSMGLKNWEFYQGFTKILEPKCSAVAHSLHNLYKILGLSEIFTFL